MTVFPEESDGHSDRRFRLKKSLFEERIFSRSRNQLSKGCVDSLREYEAEIRQIPGAIPGRKQL
ncbi:MAG TPA: hypothetical protein DIW81_10050 [Planctomycetaceae bacterium]|nr:hypothetical protein [Planctomycetaceae bacterium]